VLGHTATYIAGVAMIAGRVVSLHNYGRSSDGNYLAAGYLGQSGPNYGSAFPIGITQNNANIGEKVTVCYSGYTTAISANSGTPERGALAYADSIGCITIARDGTIGSRIGFFAQTTYVPNRSKCLVYLSSFYESM
jgi:hypothetical protein